MPRLLKGTSRTKARLNRPSLACCAAALVVLVSPGPFCGPAHAQESQLADAHASARANSWPFWGGNVYNTHANLLETSISPATVSGLRKKWEFATHGDVSATPTVENNALYVTDWGGYLYRLKARSGKAVWERKLSDLTGNDASLSRTSPAIAGNSLILGDQGSAAVLAIDKESGLLQWSTTLDHSNGSWITGSPVVVGDRVYVGVASNQEGLAAKDPRLELDFRGSIACLDRRTGEILWQTYTVPEGYTGGAVWGSNLVVDEARNSLYASTGNNYSVPESVDKCISGATGAVGKLDCLARRDYIDALLALDLDTGRVKWDKRFEGTDTWTVSCIVDPTMGIPCPDNAGPDYDFGSAPNLFTVHEHGRTAQVLGAGQKSGMYWAVNPNNGGVLWGTQVGPGGSLGGIEWGSATDGDRVYVAVNNSNRTAYTLASPHGQPWSAGSWAALDAATGKILWQVPASGKNPLKPTQAAGATGQMSVANGVVFAGSLSGDMVALDGASGKTLWKFASGGSVVGGASIVDGTVYWGSGYAHLNIGTANNKLFAFSLPGNR